MNQTFEFLNPFDYFSTNFVNIEKVARDAARGIFQGFALFEIIDLGYILEQISLNFGLRCSVCIIRLPNHLKFAPNSFSGIDFGPN